MGEALKEKNYGNERLSIRTLKNMSLEEAKEEVKKTEKYTQKAISRLIKKIKNAEQGIKK